MSDNIAFDIEPDALREAELMQARELLRDLEGQTVAAVHVEDTRIAIETANGTIYYFYGFMGEDVPE
jgi:hypothetical protein